MRSRTRSIVAVVAMAVLLIVPPAVRWLPADATQRPRPVRAQAAQPDGALIGIWPHQNLSTVDTTNIGLAAAFEPGQYTQPSALSDIGPMNTWQGKANSIIQFYDAVDSGAFNNWAPIIWNNYHAIPMMTMNTGGGSGHTNADVAAGVDDSQLLGYANALKGWINGTDIFGNPAPTGGRRMFIRLDWEPNGNWYKWAPTNTATDCTNLLKLEQDYVAMWRHVRTLVMGVGLTSTQVSWVFSVNSADAVPLNLRGCANGASDITKNVFPGDAYTDWVGIDAYSFCSVQTPATVMDNMVKELKTLSTRPLSTNEVGASTANLVGSCGAIQAKGAWIASYLNYLQANDIKMTVWFNTDSYENSRPTDWAVFAKPGPQDIASHGDCTYAASNGITYNTYCEYPQGLAAPFFAGADAANNRVVSDAEFQGTWVLSGGAPPAAPVLSGVAGRNQVSLSWTAPANGGRAITGYRVLKSTAPGTETLLATTDGATTTLTDTAVTAGSTYYYEVQALNAIGIGPLSNEVSKVPLHAGALVGLWPDLPTTGTSNAGPSQAYLPSQLTYVPDMNAWQGKSNSVINFQSTLDPAIFQNRAPMIWDQYHAIPMVTMDLGGSNADVANGKHDNNLFMFGEALQGWINGTDVLGGTPPVGGRRIYLALNAEGNGSSAGWAPLHTATDCASLLQAEQDYVAAFRRAQYLIGLVGFTPAQLQFVFTVDHADATPPALANCANGASDVTSKIYPGDAYVDWTGIDGFSSCSAVTPANLFNPMITKLKTITTRPVSIDDVGTSTAQPLGTCTTTTAAAKGSWIDSYLANVENSGVKMSVWRNLDEWRNLDSANNITDWAVFSQSTLDPASKGDCTYSPSITTTYNVYCEYPQRLARSYFTGGDPAYDRIVADAEFRGTWT